MENLILYLIKSSTLLLLFYATYFLLIKKNTFFTTNRWFLLLGICCSALLPLLSFQKTVWVEPAISSMSTLNFQDFSTNSVTNFPIIVEEAPMISWEMALGLLYGFGVVLFLTQLLVEFYSLRKIIKNHCKIKQDGFEFIEINEAISPFSFFKKIVYNRSLFQPEELQNIIEHEKIHAKQMHSLDVLIARMYCILWWWNPLVWLYKKAIIQNLEFIADQNALAKAKDKKSYLLTLLKTSTAEKHVAITNHFYQSLIKKRIVMLHTNQSKKYHSWKYFVVLPALVFFMLTYQVEVVAQEKPQEKLVEGKVYTSTEVIIEQNTTESEILEKIAYLKNEFGLKLAFKKIKRNTNGKITTLNILLSDKKGTEKVYTISSSKPIEPFVIFVNIDQYKELTFGFGDARSYLLIHENNKNQKIADSIAKEENKGENKALEEVVSTKIAFTITATAEDKNIIKEAAFFSKVQGITISLKSVSRTEKGQIKAINIELSDKKGTLKIYKVSSDEAIKPFNIFVEKNGKNVVNFGFSTTIDSEKLKQDREVFEQNKMSSNSKKFIFSLDEIDSKFKSKSQKNFFENRKSALEENQDFPIAILIVADNKVISEGDFYKLDPNSIVSVKIVKRDTNEDLEDEEVFKRYEEKAKNGFLKITTKSGTKSGSEQDYKTYAAKDNIVSIKENKDVDYKKAFISLNGKEISVTEMEKLNPVTIGSISIIKSGNTSKFLSKYGERSKYGLILIETTGFKEPISKIEINALSSSFKLDAENGGFTIHKRTQKSDFEFYEKYLKEIGVIAKISGIARNKNGFITAIKIKLEDEKSKNKMSENWTTSKNPNGIPDISVGRKNGKLKLTSD